MRIAKRLLLITAIFLVLPFVIEPPMARFFIQEPASLELVPLESEALDALDWRVRAYFDDTVATSLDPAGFERVATFLIPTDVTYVRIYGAIFRAQDRPELATAFAYLNADRTVLASRRLNFITVLDDGRTLETDNDPLPTGDTAGVRSGYLPMSSSEDLERMHQVHCAFVDASVQAERIVWISSGEEIAEIQRELDAELAARISSGFWFEDAQGSEHEARVMHRPTWRGAFARSWEQAWPFGAIRRAALLNAAEQQIGKLPTGEALAAACVPLERPPS